jgi:NAD(P)-dependent dehydrogenase (short-subunit alcohol dehydrogenase family)
MSNPVVLITGALSGIGRATALAFARDKARLMISGRRDEAGHSLQSELRLLDADARFFRADVRDEEQVRALIARTIETFGRLDIAVNNAGTEGVTGLLTEQTVESFRNTFDTNVLGTLLCLKHEIPILSAQGSGSIINISSIAGQVGMAGAGTYAASKHAVEGLTKSAALEVAGRGVRVNAVAPGPVATTMLDRFVKNDEAAKATFLASIPLRRAAQVEEVAETILFLASEKARYLTGQSITIDGGYTAQ